MRSILLASIVALSVLAPAASSADVGPAPKCPPGTYSAYLYGRRCVPNGSHLEKDANGNVQVVSDNAPALSAEPKPPPVKPTPPEPPPPAPSAAATPAPTPFASPPPPASGAPAPAPTVSEASPSSVSPPPAQRGCSCEVPSAPMTGAFAALGGLVALVATGLWRRRSKRVER